MNTENFSPLKNIDLDFIENKQMEIMFQYEPTEKEIFKNFDIDTYEDQEIFKKYCWRVTEEISEALEDTEHPQHFKEEIVDAFNFLIELYNLYGWSVTNLEWIFNKENIKNFGKKKLDPVTAEIFSIKVIKSLGLTANLLKNRKWRQSQYLVDLLIFEKRFKQVWIDFQQLFWNCGITPEELFQQWSLKYQVNLYRLRTNY
ncbi:MAG: hypothetical protein PHF86_02525 [Candidatus Nanoarchaeia archaeon]|nr:hypothetical protein [Candidatus Nanoarchaeia archaeon]